MNRHRLFWYYLVELGSYWYPSPLPPEFLGPFLTTSLARDLRKPSKTIVIKGLEDDEGIPAATFSQDNVCTISSAADLRLGYLPNVL